MFRCDIVKDDSGAYASFTEQGSSAFQVTAAEVMDVIAILPDCDGQTADAESACAEVILEDAPVENSQSLVLRTRRGPRCTLAGKPSGADTDARCRPPFAVQTFAAAAPVWVCPWRRAQEDQTRHGGNHGHAKDSCPAQDEADASHTEAWMRSTTRNASTRDSSPQCLAHAGLE